MDANLVFHPAITTIACAQSERILSPLIAPAEVQQQPGRFAEALAHEIRNPLTNINLALDMLEPPMVDPEKKVYLDIIRRGSVRINNLVCEWLIQQEAAKAHARRYSIHLLLDEVLELAADRIKLKNILVTKEYMAADNLIMMDPIKTGIALTNLIMNAIDAMTKVNGQLKLIESSIDGKYTLQIEDNGCGISPENLENIFKPFFTDKLCGLGLGLSTTFDILQADYIRIKVESQEGQGTRFILSFDRSRVRLDPHEPVN